MATHFVQILSRNGWVSVLEPARTLFRGEAGGGRLRGYSGVTGSYQIHTHIPDIAPPQLRGDFGPNIRQKS